MELTNEMIERNDIIDNAVYGCILTLAEKSSDKLQWNMEIIGETTEAIKAVLARYDIKVRHPGIVMDGNGSQHYAE